MDGGVRFNGPFASALRCHATEAVFRKILWSSLDSMLSAGHRRVQRMLPDTSSCQGASWPLSNFAASRRDTALLFCAQCHDWPLVGRDLYRHDAVPLEKIVGASRLVCPCFSSQKHCGARKNRFHLFFTWSPILLACGLDFWHSFI